MAFQVLKGLRPPVGRPVNREKLDALIALARQMEAGDAAVLTLSESQTFRVILNAIGYDCFTDAYRCDVHGKTLAFKLAKS